MNAGRGRLACKPPILWQERIMLSQTLAFSMNA